MKVLAILFLLDSSCTSGQATTLKATTDRATLVSTTSAAINGIIEDPGTPSATIRWFHWGTSMQQSSTTPQVSVPSLPQNIIHPLTGLTPNTTYYYSLCAKNASNVIVCGGTMQFKTLAALPTVDLSITGFVWRDGYQMPPFASLVMPIQQTITNYGTDFQFTVKNSGTSSLNTGNVTFSLYDGSVSNQTLLYKSGVWLGTIAPQATQDVQFIVFAPNLRLVPHTYNLILVIDSMDMLPESNENNNSISLTMVVP